MIFFRRNVNKFKREKPSAIGSKVGGRSSKYSTGEPTIVIRTLAYLGKIKKQ